MCASDHLTPKCILPYNTTCTGTVWEALSRPYSEASEELECVWLVCTTRWARLQLLYSRTRGMPLYLGTHAHVTDTYTHTDGSAILESWQPLSDTTENSVTGSDPEIRECDTSDKARSRFWSVGFIDSRFGIKIITNPEQISTNRKDPPIPPPPLQLRMETIRITAVVKKGMFWVGKMRYACEFVRGDSSVDNATGWSMDNAAR